MKKMGILGDIQPIWLYLDGPAIEKVFGHSGMRYFIPTRTYRESGIVLAGGSDHMIGFDKNKATNPYNPFLSIWIAVARKMTSGEVLYPEERLTRQEALQMYTIWPAYMQFNEQNRGSIERGKLADAGGDRSGLSDLPRRSDQEHRAADDNHRRPGRILDR